MILPWIKYGRRRWALALLQLLVAGLLVYVGASVFWHDAKSSTVQDLSGKTADRLIAENATDNQKAFYRALKEGTLKKVVPRGQRAIDYFKGQLQETFPDVIDIENTIDFYVNDMAIDGYNIFKTTH